MRRGASLVVGLVALGALATVVATSVAGRDDPDIVSPDRGIRPVIAEEVAPGPATTAPATLRRPRRRAQEVTYFQTPNPIEIPPQTEEAVEVNKCPKGSEAVGGYFATGNPGTFLDLNQPSPDSARKWRIGAFNNTTTADRAIFGIVCISGVK